MNKLWKTIITIKAVIALVGFIPNMVMAQNQDWQTVRIPGICTYQIPPSVEMQGGAYKKVSETFYSNTLNNVLEIKAASQRAVAQPRGINNLDPFALSRYCRIIVETDSGAPGEYLQLGERITGTADELAALDKEIRSGIESVSSASPKLETKFKVLSWYGTKIVQKGNYDAILTTYTRSINEGPPVLVSMYSVQNNDMLHRVIICYRLSEKEIWSQDLDKVIDTMKFTKR